MAEPAPRAAPAGWQECDVRVVAVGEVHEGFVGAWLTEGTGDGWRLLHVVPTSTNADGRLLDVDGMSAAALRRVVYVPALAFVYGRDRTEGDGRDPGDRERPPPPPRAVD